MMRTLEDILRQLTGHGVFTDLTDLMRAYDEDFPELEDGYQGAVAALRAALGDGVSPGIDAFIPDQEAEVIANILYAAYLGHRANLENFHAPWATDFVARDFSDYLREHLMNHFPVCREARAIRDQFFHGLSEEHYPHFDAIADYFTALKVSGPKLAHYAGYVISNHLLPWVEPGYQEDELQTAQYKSELLRYVGYLPL